MSIYITQQKKEEIEAKISEIEQEIKEKSFQFTDNKYSCGHLSGQVMIYKEILSESIVLPVAKDWDEVELYPPDNESQVNHTLKYKNGVIIKP